MMMRGLGARRGRVSGFEAEGEGRVWVRGFEAGVEERRWMGMGKGSRRVRKGVWKA